MSDLDGVVLPLFKPAVAGTDLFVWDQAALFAEKQFVKHPGVTELTFGVQYGSGVRNESFVLGGTGSGVSTVKVLGVWAAQVQAVADLDAVRALKAREGWVE